MEGPHEETLNIVINKCTSLRMYVFLLSSYIREKQGKYSNIDHVLMFSIETLKKKTVFFFSQNQFLSCEGSMHLTTLKWIENDVPEQVNQKWNKLDSVTR